MRSATNNYKKKVSIKKRIRYLLQAAQGGIKIIFTNYFWNLLFFFIPSNYRIAIVALNISPLIQSSGLVNNPGNAPDDRSIGIYIAALFLLTNFSLHPILSGLCIATVAYHSLHSLYLFLKNSHDFILFEYHLTNLMLMLIITCSFLPMLPTAFLTATALLTNLHNSNKVLLFYALNLLQIVARAGDPNKEKIKLTLFDFICIIINGSMRLLTGAVFTNNKLNIALHIIRNTYTTTGKLMYSNLSLSFFYRELKSNTKAILITLSIFALSYPTHPTLQLLAVSILGTNAIFWLYKAYCAYQMACLAQSQPTTRFSHPDESSKLRIQYISDILKSFASLMHSGTIMLFTCAAFPFSSSSYANANKILGTYRVALPITTVMLSIFIQKDDSKPDEANASEDTALKPAKEEESKSSFILGAQNA